MRHATLVELARTHGVRLPPALTQDWPPKLSGADERGWFRFQRLYDTARSVLRTPADVRRLVTETAEDERAEGSRWLEIQVDPSGYAGRFGGITAMTELVLDAAADAADATGVGIGVIIAANRTKHPLEARTLARLAAQYAGRGVTGFGLSNDERRGPAHDFAPAFRIANGPGCCWSRTAASWPARPASRPASTTCTRTGSATASGPPRIPPWSSGWPPRASPARSARPPTSRSASRRSRPRSRCAACSTPASRSRSGPMTRCCSARGWPRSTRSPGTRTGSPTPSSPTWPAPRS
jgi:adenosine deaminase